MNVLERLENPKPQDWSEDFNHENGKYECVCLICDNHFLGHKRRVICKMCDVIERFQQTDKELKELRVKYDELALIHAHSIDPGEVQGLQHEIEALKEAAEKNETMVREWLVQIMATAISGFADSVIVAQQKMGFDHALAAVKQCVTFAKESSLMFRKITAVVISGLAESSVVTEGSSSGEHAFSAVVQLRDYALRLKEGDLTPEEFHNLCHNKEKSVSPGEFCNECAKYQRKLFGFSPIIELQERFGVISKIFEKSADGDYFYAKITPETFAFLTGGVRVETALTTLVKQLERKEAARLGAIANVRFYEGICERQRLEYETIIAGLNRVVNTATLHYMGQAFDPEHMRRIANYCIGLINGEKSPEDFKEMPEPILIGLVREQLEEALSCEGKENVKSHVRNARDLLNNYE